MSCRDEVERALIDAVLTLTPSAEKSDISFFGAVADVSSPLPRRYGLDITPEMVYNIRKSTVFRGVLLFSDVWEGGGFLNFNLSPEVWELIADEAISLQTSYEPDDPIELSPDPALVRAMLLDAAHESKGEGVFPPSDPVISRAFRFCLMADSLSRRSLAARAAYEAISLHRRNKALGNTAGVISKKAALAMAAALNQDH